MKFDGFSFSSPKIPGEDTGYVYALLDDNHEVVYVGQTVRFPEERVREHRDKQFTTYEFAEVPRDELDDFERGEIQRYLPRYNSHHAKEDDMKATTANGKAISLDHLKFLDPIKPAGRSCADVSVTLGKPQGRAGTRQVSILIRSEILEEIGVGDGDRVRIAEAGDCIVLIKSPAGYKACAKANRIRICTTHENAVLYRLVNCDSLDWSIEPVLGKQGLVIRGAI